MANGTIDVGSGGAQAGVNLTYTGVAAMGETTDRVINIGFNGTASHTITANNASACSDSLVRSLRMGVHRPAS